MKPCLHIVWLYVYRVKRECKEGDIVNYIKKHVGFNDVPITVRELPSEQNKLKCFVVTAPIQKKDQMYDPEFWPRFVGVKRFDFKKHKTFLESSAGDFLAKT